MKQETTIKNTFNIFKNDSSYKKKFSYFNELGIKRFNELGFPGKTHEMFTYVDTQKLFEKDFLVNTGESDETLAYTIKKLKSEESMAQTIVLVDGKINETLSDYTALKTDISVKNIENSFLSPYFASYLTNIIQHENDVFSLINSSFFQSGLLIQVNSDCCLNSPIEIIHISTGDIKIAQISTPRILFNISDNSHCNLIVKYSGVGNNYFTTSLFDYIVGECSSLKLTEVQNDNEDSCHFSKNTVELNKKAHFTETRVSTGAKLSRHHIEVNLKGEGSKVNIKGLSLAKGDNQAHNYIRIYHNAPGCSSRLVFKNIVNDSGKISTDGTVVVKRGAMLSFSDQLINNLMLSNKSFASSKPNLMIYADDVKCTHGATTSFLDEEQLLYLKSRGLSYDAAKELITKSFAATIFNEIEYPSILRMYHNYKF